MSGMLWIFATLDAGALAMLLAELRAPKAGLARTPRRASLPPAVAIAALLFAYGLQLGVLLFAVRHQAVPPSPATAGLVQPLAGPVAAHRDAVVAAMLALGALQTYALLQLYRSRLPALWIGAGAALMCAASIAVPAMISADAYAYVAQAALGARAYDPPAAGFGGVLAPVGVWWSVPLAPAPYGPLWLGIAWLVTAPFAALAAKIAALRVCGAASIGVLLFALRRAGMPPRVLAVTALNPGLYLEFVASAHNDLAGVAALLGIAALAYRRPAVAALGILAGGLVKLPLAILSLPLLGRAAPTARVALAIAAPAAAIALSLAAGGFGFARAMLPHVVTSPAMAVPATAVALAVAAAILAAAWRPRRLRAVVWLIALAPAYSCVWYLVWGIPYALRSRRVLGYLLVGLPFAAMLFEVKFFTLWTLWVAVPAVAAWQVLAFAERRRA